MYYAISKDGNVYREKRIDDLPIIDSILCYLRSLSGEDYKTQNGNTYTWYQYEFIDRNENPVAFKMGTCEVVFIEKDDGSYYLRGRRFTIRDQYGREGIFSISGPKGYFDDPMLRTIATKLVPFMLGLSACGGWDGYWSKYHQDDPNSMRIVYGDE